MCRVLGHKPTLIKTDLVLAVKCRVRRSRRRTLGQNNKSIDKVGSSQKPEGLKDRERVARRALVRPQQPTD